MSTKKDAQPTAAADKPAAPPVWGMGTAQTGSVVDLVVRSDAEPGVYTATFRLRRRIAADDPEAVPPAPADATPALVEQLLRDPVATTARPALSSLRQQGVKLRETLAKVEQRLAAVKDRRAALDPDVEDLGQQLLALDADEQATRRRRDDTQAAMRSLDGQLAEAAGQLRREYLASAAAIADRSRVELLQNRAALVKTLGPAVSSTLDRILEIDQALRARCDRERAVAEALHRQGLAPAPVPLAVVRAEDDEAVETDAA